MSSYLLFFLSLSLSHLIFHLFISHSLSPSPLHLPHSLSLASLSPMGFSPMPLHLPHLFIYHGFFPHLFVSPIDLFIFHGFFPFTSSSPQLIAPSISYLNFPLPTVLTIGNAAPKFFFTPMLLWWFVYEICNCFPFLLFDSICGFCGMCYD